MSKWVNFRDELLSTLKFDEVDDKMKEDFTKWLLEIAMPLAETSADSFISQVKDQAVKESGWTKLRDLVVLPFIITGGLWVVKQSLVKTTKR